MPAYWVARVKISDEKAYQEYVKRAPQAFSKFGAKFLARGDNQLCLEGGGHFTRSVIIEFPNVEQAIACHQSPEYQAAARYRRDVAIVDSWVIDGE